MDPSTHVSQAPQSLDGRSLPRDRPGARGRSAAVPRRESGQPHQVVVLGGGYAGVMAANRILATVDRGSRGRRLARRVLAEVTVVNPSPEFTERIRLHEVAAGSRPTASVPMSEVLHPAARVLTGTALRIDPAARVVRGDGWELGYDSLVYAVGSRTATGTPGSEAHAVPFGDAGGADRLRRQIAALRPGDVVAVVGGGLSGVEAAAEFAEGYPALKVRLVSSGLVAPGLAGPARQRLLATLKRLGVVVSEHTRVAEVLPGSLRLAGGGELAFSACAWAASMSVPGLARDSGLPVDASGRLIVDGTLLCPDYPEIAGAGDAVAPPPAVAAHLRMSCAAALPLGSHAATAVLAAIDPGAAGPLPFSIGFLIQCISLGRARGLIQAVRPDDTPRRIWFGGRAGARAKEAVCRYTISSLRNERERPGSYRTVRGPAPSAPLAPDAPSVTPAAGSTRASASVAQAMPAGRVRPAEPGGAARTARMSDE